MESQIANVRVPYLRSFIGKQFTETPSAITRWLGGIIEKVEADELVVTYIVRPDMTNPVGILHGGVSAMIMDDMMGGLVFLLGSEYAHTTINLNCDYLNPAPVGTTITAKAKIIRAGKNIVHCECELSIEGSHIIAKSTSNLIQTAVRLPF